MLTFNLRASNSNFYRGHEPSNTHSNCWSGCENDALVLTLGQARAIAGLRNVSIVFAAVEDKPMSDAAFERELFCAGGGNWFEYNKETL